MVVVLGQVGEHQVLQPTRRPPSDDVSGGHVFRYNIAYDNREYGLAIGGYTGGEVHHCVVHNNVFVNNQREIGFSKNAGHHHRVVNNILFNPAGQSINYLSQPTDTVIDSNCYLTRNGDRPGKQSVSADPLFIDVAKHDFRLRSGSPCIEAGQAVKDLPPPTPDIGVFEFER